MVKFLLSLHLQSSKETSSERKMHQIQEWRGGSSFDLDKNGSMGVSEFSFIPILKSVHLMPKDSIICYKFQIKGEVCQTTHDTQTHTSFLFTVFVPGTWRKLQCIILECGSAAKKKDNLLFFVLMILLCCPHTLDSLNVDSQQKKSTTCCTSYSYFFYALHTEYTPSNNGCFLAYFPT